MVDVTHFVPTKRKQDVLVTQSLERARHELKKIVTMESRPLNGTLVKNFDAITKCETHDCCFANCFETCQEGPFSADFTVCSNLEI